jgi:hypothetical protein
VLLALARFTAAGSSLLTAGFGLLWQPARASAKNTVRTAEERANLPILFMADLDAVWLIGECYRARNEADSGDRFARLSALIVALQASSQKPRKGSSGYVCPQREFPVNLRLGSL